MTLPSHDYLPSWVDAKKWFDLPVQERWNGSQAILLILGIETPQGAMAALRGIPSKPPGWVMLDRWNAASNSREEVAIDLEHRAALDVAEEEKAERARTEAAKNCQHVYADMPRGTSGVKTRACKLCGHVEDALVARLHTRMARRAKAA